MSISPEQGSGHTEKSPWPDAIGPLFTSKAILNRFGLAEEDLEKLEEEGKVLTVTAVDGEEKTLLYPVSQFLEDGTVIPALSLVVSRLGDEEVINRYMLAAWMNKPNERIGGKSPWESLRDSPHLLDHYLEVAVEGLRERMLQ